MRESPPDDALASIGSMAVLRKSYAGPVTLAAVFLLTALPGCETQASMAPSPKGEIHMEMRNISYHYTDQIAVHVETMEGTLKSTEPGHIPVSDDTKSFDIEVSSAQVFVTVDSMAHVLNDYVLAHKDAPIKQISIQSKGNSLIVKGKKGVMPFEATATLSVTAVRSCCTPKRSGLPTFR
jgi:hypothetical protein